MRTRSLRLRLLIIQAVTLLVALFVTGAGLIYLFERHVERRIGSELDTYVAQIAARLSFDKSGKPLIADRLADPRFDRIYSGLYWQVDNETRGRLARSRSLWDTQLALPADRPALGRLHVHVLAGPQHSRLLAHERRLAFDTPTGEQIVRIVVAIDRADLERVSRDFAVDVAVALLALALILVVAGWVQVTIGLKPLLLIRRQVARVRTGEAARIPADLPREVAPLADEVNELLGVQEAAIEQARQRADNLAHGFKTPLTALNTDVKRLRDRGESEIAADIERVAQAMRRQIERELARARIRARTVSTPVAVKPLIDGIIATLRRTPEGEHKQFELLCDPALALLLDKDDLAEMCGNLLENAVRHGGRTIRVTTESRPAGVSLTIEDDGAGISPALRARAVQRGVRLDETGAGSGLGLAITNDVLEAYGGRLDLSASELGGLAARIELPFRYLFSPAAGR